MLIGSNSKSTINKLKSQLSSEFKMTDPGKAKKILEMEINRYRKTGKVHLTQKGVFAKGTIKIQYLE